MYGIKCLLLVLGASFRLVSHIRNFISFPTMRHLSITIAVITTLLFSPFVFSLPVADGCSGEPSPCLRKREPTTPAGVDVI